MMKIPEQPDSGKVSLPKRNSKSEFGTDSQVVSELLTGLKQIKVLEGSRYRIFKAQPGSYAVTLAPGGSPSLISELFPRRMEEIDGVFTTVCRKKDVPEIYPNLLSALCDGRLAYVSAGFSTPKVPAVLFPINRVSIVFSTPPSDELLAGIEDRFEIRMSENSRKNRSLYEFRIDGAIGSALYHRTMVIKAQLPTEVPSVVGVHLQIRRRSKPER